MNFWKTPAAAKELGIAYTQLVGLLRYGKINPPSKDSSGDLIWTPADLDRAREALANQKTSRANGSAVAV